MSIKNSKIFYINSDNRNSGTASDFNYTIDIPKNETFTHCCVLQASVPVTYYLVRKGMNSFTVIEDGVPRVVYIEEGNYNNKNFINEFLLQINLNPPQYDETDRIAYDISYNEIIDKFTITYVSPDIPGFPPGITDVKFKFNSSLAYQFGFDIDKVYSFTGNKLVSPNIPNFIPESVVNIHSDMIESHDGILQEIYSYNTGAISNIIYMLSTDFRAYSKKLKTGQSNQFHFKLLDSDKNYLDTNGHPIILTVLLYSLINYENNINEYIKYRIQN